MLVSPQTIKKKKMLLHGLLIDDYRRIYLFLVYECVCVYVCVCVLGYWLLFVLLLQIINVAFKKLQGR